MRRFLALLTVVALGPTAPVAAQEAVDPYAGGAGPAAGDTAEAAPTEAAAALEFHFGSYGRIVGAGNLRGGSGKHLNVVSFGPRLEESPYLELDFGTSYRDQSVAMDTVVTLALTDALFHLDGDFDGAVALRNAYVDVHGFGVDGLSMWAGSRMYRGDDIYLLDFWPLDELNTVGGGARFDIESSQTTIAIHGGVNQLRDDFQYQEETVAGPSFETEQLIRMDRVRGIGSLRLEQRALDIGDAFSAKLVVWTEYQALGAGAFENEDDVLIELPADRGYTVGAQLGAWGFGTNAFANLFFRYSRGLAAYDELGVPYGLDTDRSATEAGLTRLALSGNYEIGRFGATVGGYVQWFQDADGIANDPDDYLEGVIAVRPVIFITDHFHQVFEYSYQRRIPEGLSARTDTYLEPAISKIAVMPTLSLARAVYARPQIRLIYSASLLNEGARDQWPVGDVRHEESVHHFLGVGAEWWFNSSSYQ